MERNARPSLQEFEDTIWTRDLLRPLLTALLATCAIAGPMAVYRALVPWHLGYVLPLAFLVTLEGVYSTRQLGRPDWRDRRGMLFRAGEVVLLLSVLRLATWAFSLGLPSMADLQLWLVDPGAFFDDQFVVVGLFLLLGWGLAVGITGDFLDLAIQPDEVAAREYRGWQESRSQLRVYRPTSRAEIVGRFASRWLWGGILLVICAALSQVTAQVRHGLPFRIGLMQLGFPTEVLAALLGYFLGGLLLMSQARLAWLRAEWYNQGLEVRPRLLSRWWVNSIVTLALVALLAALLPIGSTNWLSRVLSAALAALIRVIYSLMFLLLMLISLLFYPLRFLFSESSELARQVPSMEVPTQAEVVSRLPEWLGGAVLWMVVAGLAGYLLVSYLSAHGVLRGGWLRWLERLRYWWRARWAGLHGAARAMAVALSARLRRPTRLGPRTGVGARAIRLSRLPPRGKIRYFYLRALHRAAERGLVRPIYKTPSEFAEDLAQGWPEAELDVEALTAAFISARYDTRPIEAGEAHAVQDVWRRLMRALRRRGGAHGG